MALYLVIQISAFLSRYIPRSWRYLIGTAVGDVVFVVWYTKRKILLENIATVLGSTAGDRTVRRVARKSMRNYCKYLIEFLDLPNMSTSHEAVSSFRVHGEVHLEQALNRGKGMILVSGHFGTIEIGGLRLSSFTDFHAVYDTFRPAYLDRLIRRKRLEKGINLIPVNAVREMLRVLHHGGTLCTLFDRPVDPGKGVPVQFFGRETYVPAGPAVLAMKTGATLLPVFQWRLPDKRFEAIVFPPVQWTATGNRDSDIQAMTQKIMDAFQSIVRERPDQWYMFRPMWPTRPAHVPVVRPETATGDLL